MIVGNGLIANSIRTCDREDVILFASGVSNSVNPSQSDFEREEMMLREHLQKDFECLVYFSTVSIEDPSMQSKAYIQHKKRMEELIKGFGKSYVILRLPNMLCVNGNPNTLVPYFNKAIKNGDKVTILDNAHRYLLTREQLCEMVNQILSSKVRDCLINGIQNEPTRVLDIYKRMLEALSAKPNYEIQPGGENYKINPNFNFENLPEANFDIIVKEEILKASY